MPAEQLCLRGHTFDRLGPRAAVVDLGANDGKFTAELLARHPDASAILVEGDPFLVGKLRERFGGQTAVKLYGGLVGASPCPRVPFHLSPVPEGNSVHGALAASWSAEETRTIEVPMIDLAGLLALAGVEQVALLKVDIEGGEYDVLPTIDRKLAARIAQLTVEFHDFAEPSWRPRTEACIAHLAGLGFLHTARGTSLRHGSPYFDCHFRRPAP